MKKELIAALALMLVFVLALINIRYMDNMIGGLIEMVDESERLMESGDFAAAASAVEAVAAKWDERDAYTHIFIRHIEIDSTTDALYGLLGNLYSKNTGEAMGGYQKLRAHLESITGMEHIRFGSIF